MANHGKVREDIVLIPVSGKAIPVYKGEVLRIVQEKGGQCVDFNAFNLHDYAEHLSQSLSRRQGLHIPKGGFGLTSSPRNRLMFQVIDKPDNCVIDMLGHRCSAAMCEAVWGDPNHTNCQDSIAEAMGEYGLPPDYTHCSYTFWMPTGWTDDGHFRLGRNYGVKKGDTVELLALMDILAVACMCGINDVSPLGNYFQAPIRLQVCEATDETNKLVEDIFRRYPPLQTQMRPEDFHVKHKVTDRECKKVAGYKPQFKRYPLKFQEVQTEIAAKDREQLERLIKAGRRDDIEDAVRSAVIEWYNKNRTRHHPLFGALGGGEVVW